MSDGTQNTNRPPNVDNLIEQAKLIYAELNKKFDLENTQEGKYVAIDVDSQRHFIADTRDEAVQKGRAELPTARFFVKRIGGVDRVSRHFPSPRFERSVRARLL
jgi:ribosomal protein L31